MKTHSTIIEVMLLIFCVRFPLCAAQVAITPESVVASPGDIGVDVGICLDNPEDFVSSIQLDLCEYTVEEEPIDFMACIFCKLTERTPTYNCESFELPNGCCRVLLYRPNPDYSIDPGLCDVVTVVYNISDSEEYIGTPCIINIPENTVVGDFEGLPLTAVGLSGEMCFPDIDTDGMPDAWDNCPSISNPDQLDTYPPQGNGIGDACDCEANFDCDADVDANDVTAFLTDFGRNQYNRPCTAQNPCYGDFLCDGDVDAYDVIKFLEDFGRSQFNNPCPVCEAGNWCVYQ